MATKHWIGAAADVTQVDKVTIANTWATNDTLTLTIGGVQFVLTIGSLTTTAQVAQTLKEAFNGETLTDTTASYTPNNTGGAVAIPQFSDLTASVSGSVVYFTKGTSGRSFTMTASEVTAGSGTATRAAHVSPTGKHFFDNAANWDTGTAPTNSDDLVFDIGDVDVLEGLSTGIQPSSVRIDMSYTGNIGLADINTDGGTDSTQYPEYLTKSLTFSNNSVTTTYTIGRGVGQGSKRIRIDAGAGQTAGTVHDTAAQSLDPSLPVVTFKGTHASNAWTVLNGNVAFAYNVGDTTTLTSLRTGTDGSSSANVYLGSDLTLATSTQSGGTISSFCSCTTHTQHGGQFYERAGAPASLYVWGGVFHSLSSSTIGSNCKVGSSGTFDRSSDNRTKAITPQVYLFKGSKFLDPNSSLTLTAGFIVNGCKIGECEVDFGNNRSFTVS